MGNINQAGLPQAPQSAGGTPIGFVMGLITNGVLQRLGDGSLWLRTGFIIAKALAPLGAACEYLRAHIFSESASAAPALPSALFCCTNGAGTYVIGFGAVDATNVYVSNDYGATWTSRAHNLGGSSGPSGMAWTGSVFVGVGTGSGTWQACTSPDGVTWTNSVTPGATGASFTTNTARAVWTGTAVVAVAQQNSATNTIMTSPTGLTGTWTFRNGAATVNAQPLIDGNAYGSIIQFGGSVMTSDATGAAWTLRTPGTIVTAAKPLAFTDRFVLFQDATGKTIQSLDMGATWSAPVSIGVDLPVYGYMNKTQTGRVYGSCTLTSQIMYSDDGVFWKVQGYVTANPASQFPTLVTSLITTDGVRSMVLLTTGGVAQKLQYAASSFNAPNGVGTGVAYLTGTGGMNAFSKVK